MILTIDQGFEAVSILDINGGISTLDDSVVSMIWNGEQAGFVLRLSVLHDRMIKFDHVAVIVAY